MRRWAGREVGPGERALVAATESLAAAAVAHELVHVRGLDDLWLRLLAVVRALFFFHPVAWWVSARLAGTDPAEQSVHSADRALFPAFGSPLRSTPMRIHRIVRRSARPMTRSRRFLATLIAIGPALLVAFTALPMAAAPAASAVGQGGDGAGHADRGVPAGHALHEAHWSSPVRHAHVTSPSGDRHDPFQAGAARAHHDGVDLGAPSGTPVRVPADGVVTIATEQFGPAPRWGTVVVVDHGDGLQTRYAHMGSLAVSVGERVVKGDKLGTVGTTGRVTGPHLHFEVLRDGKPVDPATVIAAFVD